MLNIHDAEDVLRRLDKYFKLKSGSLGDPGIYLDAKQTKTQIKNRVVTWA